MSKKFWLAALLVLVAGLTAVLSGCQKSEDVIKIGTVGPLSGNYATYGQSTKQGVEAAVKQINDAGGLHGRKIKVISEDTAGSETEAVNATRKLIERDGVVAIVGAVLSHETLSAAPIANDEGVPMITSSSTAPGIPQTGEYIFRNCIADTVQAAQLAEYAAAELGLSRFAVLYTNNDYGNGLKDAFVEKAEDLAEVVAVEAYNDGDQDFNAQLTNIARFNPDAIYIAGYYSEAAKIARQARAQGIDAVLLGADGFYSRKLVELGGDAVEGAIFTAGFYADDPSEAVQEFVSTYEEMFGETPDMFAAQAYDAAMIILEAVRKAGLDRKAIRDEMAKIDYPGITGRTRFDSDGDAVKDVLILKVEGGEFKRVR